MKILKHKPTIDTIARISICLGCAPIYELPKSAYNIVTWQILENKQSFEIVYDDDARTISADFDEINDGRREKLFAVAEKYDLGIGYGHEREESENYVYDDFDEDDNEARQLH